MIDAFFFFRPEDVKDIVALKENFIETSQRIQEAGISVHSLSSLNFRDPEIRGKWEYEDVINSHVLVLCIGPDGILLRQVELIAEAAQEAALVHGIKPRLIRVYLPGAPDPIANWLPLSRGFRPNDFIDFKNGIEDDAALKRLEDMIRSSRRLEETQENTGLLIFNRPDTFPPVLQKDRDIEKTFIAQNRRESFIRASIPFSLFIISGVFLFYLNVGLSLAALYCGLLVFSSSIYRYGIHTGYFLISPSYAILVVLASIGLMVTSLVSTVEVLAKTGW